MAWLTQNIFNVPVKTLYDLSAVANVCTGYFRYMSVFAGSACVCKCCLRVLAVGWERRTSAPEQCGKHVAKARGNHFIAPCRQGQNKRCCVEWKHLHAVSDVIYYLLCSLSKSNLISLPPFQEPMKILFAFPFLCCL